MGNGCGGMGEISHLFSTQQYEIIHIDLNRKVGIIGMRREDFALVTGSNSRHHLILYEIDSTDQIVTSLRKDLVAFLNSRHDELSGLDVVKVYYDCGQSPVTNLLHQTFENDLGCPVEFVQNVRPAKYRLFQLADLVCTLHLMELKIKNGIPLTCSENRFFGGPRDFQRNILKRIKRKEI